MANPVRKRKAVTKDSAASNEAALFDELGRGPLNGALSDSGDDVESEEEDDWEEGSFESDEESLSIDDDNSRSNITPPLTNGYVSSPRNDDGQLPEAKLSVDSLIDSDYSKDGSRDEEDHSNNASYTLSTDAHGNARYLYREIDPIYDSDDSDAPATNNTIGNIPLSFYDSYPHIGYDLDGKRVMRPAKGGALDSLLDSIELPKGWTGLTDPATGKPLELTEEELDVLKRVTKNELPEDGYDPYPDLVEYFTSKTETMPLSAAPEPKRRFVPSKHEAVRVMKIVKAIREGRIQPYRTSAEQPEDETIIPHYDLWADEAPRSRHSTYLPAPKLPPPSYQESYHPPPEYIPDEQERKAWEEMDEEDREQDFLPVNHDALRKVPGYDRFVKDKFERCLDLYLAPRVRRSKLNIDPESLLPKLPNPDELKPFPARCDIQYHGHTGRVRSVAFDPSGSLLATGGDDSTVRIWIAQTGRLVSVTKLVNEEAVNAVSWRPGKEACILAAAAGESIFLIAPDLGSLPSYSDTPLEGSVEASRELLNAGWAVQNSQGNSQTQAKEPPAKWVKPEPRLQDRGVLVQINLRSSARVVCWHRRGEYFATVSPKGQTSGVAIHTLSRHLTQLPFRKLKGLPQSVQFHPTKPVFFVATQRTIRSYDLAKQELLKILQPGARWISSFDVHPGGDNLVVGSFDKRLLWMDLDLSVKPYKTLRYHGKAIRSVKFHQGRYPLFVDASDDGTLQVFHGRVVGDLMENANIVPLKVLKGHRVESGLGVLDVDWHPSEPWCVSAGADGTCRLWRP